MAWGGVAVPAHPLRQAVGSPAVEQDTPDGTLSKSTETPQVR